MKKLLMLSLALCLLAGLVLTAQAAESSHPHSAQGHCICGGAAEGVGDHVCQTVTQWTPISSTVDFGALESGAYYLTCDVKLTTKPTIIGDMTPIGAADGPYTLEKAKAITLCLNGYTLSTTQDRVFKGIGQQSTLNICDCSYDGERFGGTIIGGNTTNGGITYTYSLSTLNIFGGNFTGLAGRTYQHGGLFVVAQDRFPSGGDKYSSAYAGTCNLYNGYLYDGHAQQGGNINVMHCSHLNLYGGTISGGTAVQTSTGTRGQGGNLFCGSTATVSFLATADSPVLITGGSAQTVGGNICFSKTPALDLTHVRLANGSPEVVCVTNGNTYVKEYTSISEAAAAATESQTLYMTANSQEAVTLSGKTVLDLNGHTLSGISVTGQLYALDSTTNDYTDTLAGKLSCALDGGTLAPYWKDASGRSYLRISEEDGYSFHRYYAGITKLTLKPTTCGFGYKAVFAGSDTVKNALATSGGYGYSLWLDGRTPVKRALGSSYFSSKRELTLRLDHFLDDTLSADENAHRAEMSVNACVFLKLKDGTVIESTPVSYHLRQMVELVDNGYSSYTTTQKNALQALSAKFSDTMLSWDIANTHHTDGGIWQVVDATAFEKKLSKSGNYYNLKAGSYALSSDIALGERTLRIPAGTIVNLCLNGHNMTGDIRMIRVYGNLNICDCHSESEGTMVSAYTGETGIYAPVFYTYHNATVNLYGGNLKATGNATSGGVVAVSHDGDYSNPNQIPGVFNMYGGTISGGNASDNGGLVVLWNDAQFNLYGGKLYGGTAKHGGGVCASGGTFRMYGGEISGCTASQGGNLYTSSAGTILLSGGTITAGTATDSGDGVHLEGNNLIMSGDITIAGNKGTDLFLACGAFLKEISLSENANVILTPATHALISQSAPSIQGLTLAESGYEFRYFNGKLLAMKTGTTLGTTTQGFSAGFSKVCINPEELGVPLSGFGRSEDRAVNQYYSCEEDYLYVTTTAITDEAGNTVLLAACDLQRPQKAVTDILRAHMSAVTGVPFENIYINASHSHSTPDLYSTLPIITQYKGHLAECFALSAAEAMADRAPVTLQVGSFDVNGLNFTRHYWYEDTNGNKVYFGDNFNSTPTGVPFYHVTENDPAMHLLKFDRQNKTDILLCNWRAHPTMTGSATLSKISSDFVGAFRTRAEEMTGMHVAFIQGAAGNQNVNSRISGESKYVKDNAASVKFGVNDYLAYGNDLATQLTDNLDCLSPVASGLIQTDRRIYTAAVNHEESTEERIADAKYVQAHYWDLDSTARKALLNEYSFSSIYHAGAVVSKSNMGLTKDFELNAFCIGDTLGFYTAPGELWNTIGTAVENASPFQKTFTVGYCNDDDKYFLYGEVMEYESYEGVYCRYVMPDTSQDMIDYWVKALNDFVN